MNVKHVGNEITVDDVNIPSNNSNETLPPDALAVYDFLVSADLWYKYCTHKMNLCAQNNHEKIIIENDALMVRHISTLEQMMQDALENAFSMAASRSIKLALDVYVLEVGADPEPDYTPKNDTIYKLGNLDVYLCDVIVHDSEMAYGGSETTLKAGVKPIVKFTEQSMRIEYDSACFSDNHIPIIWHPPYVETWDIPEQITEDSGRHFSGTVGRSVLPPLKRVYKYGMNIENQTGLYSYSLFPYCERQAINIVGNEEMYKTFSFLPWIKVVPNDDIPQTHLVTRSKTEPFYILDGTGATVSMNGPEPIYENGGWEVTRHNRIWYNETKGETEYATGVSTGTVLAAWYNFYTTTDSGEQHAIRPGTIQQWLTSLQNAGLMSSQTVSAIASYTIVMNGYDGTFIFGFCDRDPVSGTYSNGQLCFNVNNPASVAVKQTTVTKQYFPLGPTGYQYQFDVTESESTNTETTKNPDAPSWAGTTTEDLTPRTTTTKTNEGTIIPANTVYMFARVKHDSDYTFQGTDIPQINDFSWVPCTYKPPGVLINLENRFPFRTFTDDPYEMNDFYTDSNGRIWYWFEVKDTIPSDNTSAIGYTDVYKYLANPIETMYAFAVTWDTQANNGGIYKCKQTVTERARKQTTTTTVETLPPDYACGNIHLIYEWNNLPIVVLSPIQSIVLTLQGMNVAQEIQPINIAQPAGSSLVSSIPVIENYYSLAQTLRDLHDELVVIKESYDDQATYTLNTTSGQERALRIMAQYITKDGRLHQIYIPPNGVYSLQLTFAISYYFTS